MSWLLFLLFGIAAAYQLAALIGLARYSFPRSNRPDYTPGISILKPVRGLDDSLESALRSHAQLEYPRFEVLIGVESMDDPAVPVVQKIIAEHPDTAVRLLPCSTSKPNAKAGKLVDLERQASYDILLVNDSDITVPRHYLRHVVSPLSDVGIGLVTCPYRAIAGSWAGRWEALGIATDFIPSTLVAPMMGIKEFGLGSTLCFRRKDLQAIGGFDSIADYIADDYQLARRITGLGLRAYMSEVVVETHLNSPTWKQVWHHQVRWSRTIRVSRCDGHAGLPVTHAGLWSLVLGALGAWELAAVLWILRSFTGLCGCLTLRYWPGVFLAPIVPLWDVFAFLVWAAGLRGDKVVWRSGRMRLSPDGRIIEKRVE